MLGGGRDLLVHSQSQGPWIYIPGDQASTENAAVITVDKDQLQLPALPRGTVWSAVTALQRTEWLRELKGLGPFLSQARSWTMHFSPQAYPDVALLTPPPHRAQHSPIPALLGVRPLTSLTRPSP